MILGRLCYSLGAGDRPRIRWIQALKAGLGDAFDTTDPIRDAELCAIGNAQADAAEWIRAMQAESLPGTATKTLEQWAERLGVPWYENDPDRTRELAARKYMPNAGTVPEIHALIQGTLGANLQEISIADGYEAQENTFWPGVNPGLGADLGGDSDGEWSSARSHFLVSVMPSVGQTVESLQEVMETTLFEALDPIVPAWVTWEYEISEGYDGFILDLDLLDITAL